MGRWLVGFLYKDVRLFCADAQALLMSLVVPVLIASILAWLESSATSGGPAPKVPVAIADLDGTPISRAVIERLRGDSNVRIQETTPDNAAEQVRNGSMAAAIVLPKGFGKQATAG